MNGQKKMGNWINFTTVTGVITLLKTGRGAPCTSTRWSLKDLWKTSRSTPFFISISSRMFSSDGVDDEIR